MWCRCCDTEMEFVRYIPMRQSNRFPSIRYLETYVCNDCNNVRGIIVKNKELSKEGLSV